jgi:hypothetical protein
VVAVVAGARTANSEVAVVVVAASAADVVTATPAVVVVVDSVAPAAREVNIEAVVVAAVDLEEVLKPRDLRKIRGPRSVVHSHHA